VRAIKVLRAEAGLTGIELGRMSGVPRETISRLEHGHYDPTAPVLHKLAKALGVEVRDIYLLEGELDAPKAGARSLAGQWFKARLGDNDLGLPDHEAVSVVAALTTVDEVEAKKEAIDLQRDAAKALLADHEPSPELREALEMAVRKHLDWLIDLGTRRKELLAEQRQGTEATSDDVRLVAVF
jgi:putative transcriptional regulator